MAMPNQKKFPNPTEKRVFINSVYKKKQTQNKLSPRNSAENHPKTNLQRGKIPLNWNKYLEQSISESSNPKPINKYPKTITTTLSTNRSVKLLAAPECSSQNQGIERSLSTTSRCIAIDCEMVGVGDGRESIVARASLVDENGACVYDTFVRPQTKVIDYRTAVSGVRPQDMEAGKDFQQVQNDVYHLIKGKLLIGHGIKNDMKVLLLSHPRKYIRDTSKFRLFREEANGRTPSLKFLASRLLHMDIQSGEHSSIEDARATMLLYMRFRHIWESELRPLH